MGAWYLTRNDGADGQEKAKMRRAAARRQFELHGFTRFETLETPHHAFLYAYHINGGPELFARKGADWIAAAGTLLHEGRSGPEAMLRLLDHHHSPLAVDALSGHFALIAHKGGVTHVATDWFGAFQLFHDLRMTTLSTSFLSLCAEQPTLDLDRQGVYEFVFHSFPNGDDTVFEQVRRLGPDRQLRLDADVRSVTMPEPVLESASPRPPDEDVLVEQTARLLLDTVRPAFEVWGDAIQCPLSGGLDSRLVLGLLRRCEAEPHVYVYGPPTSPDVMVARDLALALNFPLEHFDKSAWTDAIEIDPHERALHQFHESDALSIDGGLFDRGANAYARRNRQANGALAVSGGCGEVLRDFFFLADRRFEPVSVIRAFYSRYDRRHLTKVFDQKGYEDSLVAKLRHAVGVPEGSLSRRHVELAYPRMRCRSFFGREISTVGRFGGYLLPFLEPGLVRHALTIPLSLKRAGALESRVMAHVDPELAALPSAYGHAFSSPPSLSHRLSEWSTVVRPIALRGASYAIQQRLRRGNVSAQIGTTVEARGLVPAGYPTMSRFFRTERIGDPLMLDRIATLEYLSAHFEDQLRE